MMTCRDFERRLEAYLDEALGPSERQGADAHLRDCDRCRELTAFARGDLGLAPLVEGTGGPEETAPSGGPAAPDLTPAVLDRTTGRACAAAAERLAELIDGRLAGDEAVLVHRHLEGCLPCRRLAEALAWVARALTERAADLAEVAPPDDAFARDVVRATAPMLRRARRAAAVRAWAGGLATRPRFALEAAYAGALGAWLLFHAAGATAQAASEAALELAASNPVAAAAELARPAAARLRIVETAGRPVAARARGAGESIALRVSGATAASWSLVRHGAQACGSAMTGDFETSAARLHEMGRDLESIWRSLLERDTRPHDDATEA